MSGLEFFLSWSYESSASFDGLDFFAAIVGVDCVPVVGDSVSDWDHITRGIVGPQLQEKGSGVDLYSEWGKDVR